MIDNRWSIPVKETRKKGNAQWIVFSFCSFHTQLRRSATAVMRAGHRKLEGLSSGQSHLWRRKEAGGSSWNTQCGACQREKSMSLCPTVQQSLMWWLRRSQTLSDIIFHDRDEIFGGCGSFPLKKECNLDCQIHENWIMRTRCRDPWDPWDPMDIIGNGKEEMHNAKHLNLRHRWRLCLCLVALFSWCAWREQTSKWLQATWAAVFSVRSSVLSKSISKSHNTNKKKTKNSSTPTHARTRNKNEKRKRADIYTLFFASFSNFFSFFIIMINVVPPRLALF